MSFHNRKELRTLCRNLAKGDWQTLASQLYNINKKLTALIPFKEGDQVTLLNGADNIPECFVGHIATITEVNTIDYSSVVFRLDFGVPFDHYSASGWLADVKNIKKVA